MPIKAVEGEYQGYPVLTITWDGPEPDTRPLTLGIGKAKKVAAAHEQIKAFLDRHKNDPRRPRPAAGPTATVNADGTRTASYRESTGGERQGTGMRAIP